MFILSLITFFIAIQNISAPEFFLDAKDKCTTPDGKPGDCINVKNCKVYMDILKKPRPLSSMDLTLLRESQCGFEGDFPKVCCAAKAPEINESENTTQTTDLRLTTIPNPPDVLNHHNLKLLDNQICGTITQRKIIGGMKTGVLDYPWMVLIAYKTREEKVEFRCGGTIINKRYILTAAHCITALPSSLTLMGVRVGDHDISTQVDCESNTEDDTEIICAERYQDLGIESTHYHPQFMKPKLQNDIGLIRLDQDADFRPLNVEPICLPINATAMLSTKKVIVTGWGATESGESSKDLLMVQLAPVPNDRCAEIYKRSAEIWYKQMCAGGTNQQDSCIGDSGGPLQVPGTYDGTVKFIQHGIVSFGLRSCGTEGFPGVYTRVIYYLDWILDTMRQ